MQIITTLMGANFRPASAKEILREAAIGQYLDLEPDPENEYDATAVKILIDGEHVGFIAAKDNKRVFEHLMEGNEAQAEIVSFESPLKPLLEINL